MDQIIVIQLIFRSFPVWVVDDPQGLITSFYGTTDETLGKGPEKLISLTRWP